MKRRFTLLSLVLFIKILGFSQQTNIAKHHLLKDGKNHYFDDTEHEQFGIKEYLPSSNNHFKKSLNYLKNATTNTQSLDSLIDYHWDSDTNQWINHIKREYAYDSNGNQTLYIYSQQDLNTSQWIKISKIELAYDSNGNTILNIYSSWDSNTNQWKNNLKAENSYDINDNKTVSFHYEWDSNTSQWILSSKFKYTYDVNGNLTLRFLWDSNTNQWINYSKTEYTYDSSGNKTLSMYSLWDTNTNQWTNNNKREYTYDTNDNKTLYIYSVWDSNTNQWINNYKGEYTYDSSGNKTLYMYSLWDSNINQWTNNFKREYTYDSNGNYTLIIYFHWDSNTNQWTNDFKREYTFDLSINTSNLFVPLYSYNGINKILTRSTDYWNETTNNWELYSNGIYYYSEVTASVNQLSNNGLELYPNPVSNILNINIQDNDNQAVFELFDVQGKKVITQKFSSKEQINLKHLNAGLYIYTITIDGNEKRGKLIKK